ncbi:MAG: type 2 isopentenyl-diphosphate Delta-isomerase [Armatimonadota bacterium]|nr:type 2 isopentenyl-diphosphate Delta-isomerase [bacterium]
MSYARASDNVQRKADHVWAALNRDVEFHTVTAGFERYVFHHEALPEINRDDVDTSVRLFGRRLSMPLIISSMTGGTAEASEYNHIFAEAAQRFGLAMGVGSQRVAVDDPDLEWTFRVRDIAPDILLFANIGAIQLNNGYDVDSCARAVEMIGADALFLHVNPLQECVQSNGNTNFQDLAVKIREVCESSDVPVVVKEVGHGISARAAGLLADVGVSGIDVAGAGGTSWSKVESYRSSDAGLVALGSAMSEWGIPTVDSLMAVRSVAPGLTLIASGGVRSGEDIAKSIALGADTTGIALPFLKSAASSRDVIFSHIARLRDELATVMFCTGSRTVEELHNAPLAKRATGSI